MDMTVTGIGSVVVAELRAAGYLESTIGQYARTIKVLARFAAGRGSDYSPELGAEFASMTVSPRTGRFSAQRRMDYGRLTRVFDSYVRTGRADLSGPSTRWRRATSRDGGTSGAGFGVGSRNGRPGPGGGHPRGVRAGGPGLPGVLRAARGQRPGRG